jgi:hypothetical protein
MKHHRCGKQHWQQPEPIENERATDDASRTRRTNNNGGAANADADAARNAHATPTMGNAPGTTTVAADASPRGVVLAYDDGCCGGGGVAPTLNVAPGLGVLTGHGRGGPFATFEVLPDAATSAASAAERLAPAEAQSLGVVVRIRAPTGGLVRVHNPLSETRPSVDAGATDADDPATLLRLRWNTKPAADGSRAVTSDGTLVIESAILDVSACPCQWRWWARTALPPHPHPQEPPSRVTAASHRPPIPHATTSTPTISSGRGTLHLRSDEQHRL